MSEGFDSFDGERNAKFPQRVHTQSSSSSSESDVGVERKESIYEEDVTRRGVAGGGGGGGGVEKDNTKKEETRSTAPGAHQQRFAPTIPQIHSPGKRTNGNNNVKGPDQHNHAVKNKQKKTLRWDPTTTFTQPTTAAAAAATARPGTRSKKKRLKNPRKGRNFDPMAQSLYEAREIQNALSSEEWDLSYIWAIALGLVGILDLVFFCLERAKRKAEVSMIPAVSILDSLAEVQKRRNDAIYSFIWWWTGYEVDIQVPDNEITNTLSLERCAAQIATLFCVLWVIEVARRAYSHALTTASSTNTDFERDPRAHGDRTLFRRFIQSPVTGGIAVFILYILLLPTCYITWCQLAHAYAEDKLFHVAKQYTMKTTFFAITHPARFKKRLTSILNVIRWFRYLAPILGNVNTMHACRNKLRTTYREHSDAKKARKVIQILWGSSKKTKSTRSTNSSVIGRLRSSFRNMKAPRSVKFVIVSKEQVAAIQIQGAFRRHLKKSAIQSIRQSRIHARSITLQCLRQSRIHTRSIALQSLRQSVIQAHPIGVQNLRQSVTMSCRMSINDSIREKELELQLEKELEEKRKVLILLRPNSFFCTIWAAIVMVTIGIDMMLKYLEEKVPTITDERSGMPHTLESYLHHSLLPTPIQEMSVCTPDEDDTSIPWYCKGILVLFQFLYIKLARLAIHEMLDLVGLVLLLDVFVTFCIGDFDRSGILVPKPFIGRWVSGIGLKLLLNPLSKPTAQTMLDFTLEAGPTRVVRWYLAYFGSLVQVFLWQVWITLVHSSKGLAK